MTRLFSILVILLALARLANASNSTLARLTFQLPADVSKTFAESYKHQLALILQRHGLTAATQQSRPTADGFFSRLFVVESPAAAYHVQEALKADTTWQQAIQQLADPAADRPLIYHFGLYQTLAGPGKTVVAGSGTQVDAGPGTATTVGSGIARGAWHTFTPLDGMPHTVVTLLQDRHGALWFASGSWGRGLWRYDGSQIHHFTTDDGLPHDRVNRLLEDPSGSLWIGTSNGLARYDGQTFTTFTTDDGLAANNIKALLQDRHGRLWIGTSGGGISCYDGKSFTTFTTADGLASNWTFAMEEDQAGQLWIGQGTWNEGEGLSRYDGHTFTTFTTADGLVDNRVHSLLGDASGRLWIGHRNGFSRFDGKSFTPILAIDSSWIWSLMEDRAGGVWVGRIGELQRFQGETSISLYPPKNAHSVVTCMLEDQSGQLWVGFQGSGLVRYSGQRLTTFTEKDGLPNNAVFGLWEDRQERLWINTAKGTCLYDGAQFTLLEATKGQRRGVVLEDRHGHLWTEQANGPHVDRWDGKHFERHTLPVRDASLVRSVRPLLEDRVGRLWFSARGSGGGLYLYDGTRWTPFTNDIDQPHHQISRMLQDRHGRLWFAGEQGVSRYDGQKVDRFTTEHGLAHNSVGDLVEAQDGRLWFATDGGLSRYDGQTFTNFTAEHSLSPRELMLDRDGHLWLTTFGVGVARFDGQVFQYITVKEGLAHNGVHPILQDHHGDIWIGTDGGLNRYRPSTVPPKIQLQAVIADHRYVATGTVHIPQFQKLIAFEFQGSSLTTLPDRMAYVYRLAGYDDVWQTVYSNRVEYQGLPEGEYTFQVKAVDCDLNYSEAPATVAVEVYPQSFVSPVRLEKIHLEDVFASFYTSYAQRPLGSVQAVNDDDQPAQVTLGFFVPELMRQPFEQTLTLPPQSDQAVDLLPRLEADILQMRDTRTLG